MPPPNETEFDSPASNDNYAYRIDPPPPPVGAELYSNPPSSKSAMQLRSLTKSSSWCAVIPGRIENRTGRAVSSRELTLSFRYNERELIVTPLLNRGRNMFGFNPGSRSPEVDLFSVCSVSRATTSMTYPLRFFVQDERGGRSNTVQIDVRVKPKSRGKSLLVPVLIGAGIAIAAAAIRRRRKTHRREEDDHQ